MKIKSIIQSGLSIMIMTVSSQQLKAQAEQPQLTATILHLDSAFWNAYNNCDTAQFRNFITDDVEFYHDKGGITYGAAALIESLKKNICGDASNRVRREVVASTVKVFPMKNGDQLYGVIILGDHLFYITKTGKPEQQTGVASFTNLWLLKDGTWKMARILSYNHHEPEYANTRKEIELTAEQLNQFSGIYKSAQSGAMTVKRDNKVLLLTGGGNTYILYPLTVNSFFTKDRDLVFEFVKNGEGKPIKMVVKERGAQADELMFEK